MSNYKAITSCFLERFDHFWHKALEELNETQSQLVIGNRLRPQICLWGYLAATSSNDDSKHDLDQVANLAVSIEMIHKASLLLDDWIDNDIERHGRPTFHTEHTPQYAVLVALHMIGSAMARLDKIFSDTIVLPHHYNLCLNTLIQTIHSMAKGALEELRLQKSGCFNYEKVCEISKLQTSEIIGNSFLLGYYAGTMTIPDERVVSALKSIGDQCGYVFQALNDLEAFVNPTRLKQHKGTLNLDFFLNRKNLAIALLYEVAKEKDQLLLQNASEQDLMRLLKEYRIIDTLTTEIDCVYNRIILSAKKLYQFGLPMSWCNGFSGFLNYVRQFAETRLRGPGQLE